MTVVKINAISFPEGAGPELEKRFAARAGAVDQYKGFEGFQLLRPTSGEDRYFVVTQWASEEDFEVWRQDRATGAAAPGHGQGGEGEKKKPVATGAELLESEVVDFDEITTD